MAALETALIINLILNITIAVTGIIVSLLIPSSRKIREGEAGTSMGTAWILVILVVMVLVSLMVLPLTFIFLEGNNLYFGLGLDVIAMIVVILAIREFFAARSAYKDIEMVEVVHTVPAEHHPHAHHSHGQQPAQYPAHYQAPEHHVQQHAPAQVNTVTVECPSCSNHIQIAEGSHTITCPYCGLSGTI